MGTIRMNVRAPRRPSLQRIFSTFPSGRPGAGLLLLRGVLGITLFGQGAEYLFKWHDLTSLMGAVALVWIVTSALLLVGYLTPLASVLAGLVSLGTTVPVISGPTSSLFATKPAVAFAAAIAAALFFLGPGAFSLDARLFGRREIVISNSHPPSDL
jgi:uncharacterized membrane protein YphA (DoxX/SURF4 family)